MSVKSTKKNNTINNKIENNKYNIFLSILIIQIFKDYQKEIAKQGNASIIRGYRDDEDTHFELYQFIQQKYLQKDSDVSTATY